MTAHERTALIVVDVQNDFCPGGALGGDLVVPVINSLSRLFSTVVATQDWHPAGHVSFASAGDGPWPDHCVQGTPGARFHPDLDTRPVRFIVRKGFRPSLDSYSGFFENDHTTPTGLEPLLKGLGITGVVVAGLATDYCVLYTALDAARCGFRTVVVRDACRGIDQPEGSLAAAFAKMEDAGVELVTSREIAGG